MARNVSGAIGVRVDAWAKATGASPDDVLGRLLDGPVHDYDGVDDFFRDMARSSPEASEIRDWWDREHARPMAYEADAEREAAVVGRRDAWIQEGKRRDVRRAGDVWAVRVSPEEQTTFEAAMAKSPYSGRSEFIRAGMALLCRELLGADPRAEVRGGGAA